MQYVGIAAVGPAVAYSLGPLEEELAPLEWLGPEQVPGEEAARLGAP